MTTTSALQYALSGNGGRFAIFLSIVGGILAMPLAGALAALMTIERSRPFGLVVAGLYAITLIGTSYETLVVIRGTASNAYGRQKARQDARLANCHGSDEKCKSWLHSNGPSYYVWCLPLLPGLSVLASGYSIGPLWGHGSTDIVFWYGLNTQSVFRLSSWIS